MALPPSAIPVQGAFFMHDDETTFQLSSRNSDVRPVLKGVAAHGRIQGVLFELTLRQTYRNDSDQVLEVIYTFPVPTTAAVLGFATTLNGERLVGNVLPREEAEAVYEDALEQGDAPALLERGAEGLHTANLGNLKPNDEIIVEVRYAHLLHYDQGRLRLAIPTTIAPRYGDPAAAGVATHQIPEVSCEASYPLSLAIDINGALAAAALETPTHAFTREARGDGGLHLELAADAVLDRDVVLVLLPASSRSPALALTTDPYNAHSPHVAMASLEVPSAPPRECITLKVLIDCSGSMAGSSMQSARQAVGSVLQGLQSGDSVSYSRFGTEVVHDLAPQLWNEAAKVMLEQHVAGTDADMGGTEMDAALRAVLALPSHEAQSTKGAAADILLITDGETWHSEPLVKVARDSGQRIFAIGVGHAHAESVVRKIALSTGGACEFATPGEQLGAAALRMLARARQEAVNDLRIDWSQDPVWEIKPQGGVFGGDTFVGIAGFTAPVHQASVYLHRASRWEVTTAVVPSDAASHLDLEGDALVRLASALRLERGDLAEAQARALAVQYQLLSNYTHCVLVHEREAEDQAQEPSQTHVVPSMRAHDWHGSASASASLVMHPRSQGRGVVYSRRPFESFLGSVADACISYSLSTSDHDPMPAHWLRPVFDALLAAKRHMDCSGSLDNAMKSQHFHRYVYKSIDKVVAQGVRREDAWILLAQWVARNDAGFHDYEGLVELVDGMPDLPHEAREKADRVFDRLLAHEPPKRIRAPRAERLQSALSGKGR
jgi:Ca-activated chloride channel family protein